MTHRTRLAVVAALSTALLLPSCSEETVEAASATYQSFVRDLNAAADSGREKFLVLSEATLAELDEQIAATKAKLDAMELDEKLQASLEAMERKRDELAQKLAQLRDAGAAGWEELREGAVEATEEARKAYDAAAESVEPR